MTKENQKSKTKRSKGRKLSQNDHTTEGNQFKREFKYKNQQQKVQFGGCRLRLESTLCVCFFQNNKKKYRNFPFFCFCFPSFVFFSKKKKSNGGRFKMHLFDVKIAGNCGPSS